MSRGRRSYNSGHMDQRSDISRKLDGFVLASTNGSKGGGAVPVTDLKYRVPQFHDEQADHVFECRSQREEDISNK